MRRVRITAAHTHRHIHHTEGFLAHSQGPVSGLASASLSVESAKRHMHDSLNAPPVATDVPATMFHRAAGAWSSTGGGDV